MKKEDAKESDRQIEEEIEEEMLLQALELSKSEPRSLVGHDKAAISSQKTPSTWEDIEEGQLREALRRSVYETHISQKG